MDKNIFYNRDTMYENIPNREKKLIKDVEELKTNGIPDNQARQGVANLTETVGEQSSKIDVLQESTGELQTEIVDKFTQINPSRFGVMGNAVSMYQGKMYTDSTRTTLAHDDTQGFRDFFEYMKVNHPFTKIILPSKGYYITDTLVIPEECRNIDFNDSTFYYFGANGTYCLSGGGVTVTDPAENYTGGYIHADWSNLTITGNYNDSRLCNGLDIIRMRNGKFSNFRIQHMNICVKGADTWASSVTNFKLYYSNIGVDTGRACNGTNFSKMDVMNCTIGMIIGKGNNVGDGNWGINGLTIDNQSLFQTCDTAIELHFIKQASIMNTYFEDNNRVFDIPPLTVNENIMNFTFDSNMVDTSQNKECFLLLRDNVRPISMKFTKNTFTGYKHLNTLFHRSTGVNGVLDQFVVLENSFLSTMKFTDIFPDTWKIGDTKTDIPFIPTIDTANWTVIQPIRIFPLGSKRFEISGAIQRVAGTTSTTLCNVPYYFTSDKYKTYTTTNQISGANAQVKNVTLEANSYPKTLNIYTVDTTDTGTINFPATVWCTR
jgi:hypothetical protein